MKAAPGTLGRLTLGVIVLVMDCSASTCCSGNRSAGKGIRMGLDIRMPIGVMFALLGALLVGLRHRRPTRRFTPNRWASTSTSGGASVMLGSLASAMLRVGASGPNAKQLHVDFEPRTAAAISTMCALRDGRL